jgi:hypothetical protein
VRLLGWGFDDDREDFYVSVELSKKKKKDIN